MKIKIINGPNLNILEKRDSLVYGNESLEDIKKRIVGLGDKLGIEVVFAQSNSEGVLVSEIQALIDSEFDGLIINAGAYSHYSIAIRDALELLTIPKIEVHLSNVYKRETFRHKSVISDIVDGVIIGFGGDSYLLALRAISNLSQN